MSQHGVSTMNEQLLLPLPSPEKPPLIPPKGDWDIPYPDD